MKKYHIAFLFLTSSLMTCKELKDSITTLKRKLTILSETLEKSKQIPHDRVPNFWAKYRYVLQDSQGNNITTKDAKPIQYQIGLVDTGHKQVKQENKRLGITLKEIVKKPEQEKNKNIPGTIFNIVAYGPSLKPETTPADFNFETVEIEKTLEVLGAVTTAKLSFQHIRYPIEAMLYRHDHTIDSLVMKQYVLQNNEKIVTVDTALENTIDILLQKIVPDMNRFFPDATSPLPTYRSAAQFLVNFEKYLSNRIFDRFNKGKQYDPSLYLEVDIIEKIKRLIITAQNTLNTIESRASKYGYLWKNIENPSKTENLVTTINNFVNKFDPQFKQILEYINEQKPTTNSAWGKNLEQFKEQLIKENEEKTLPIEPIILPVKSKKPEKHIKTDPKTEEMMDLLIELRDTLKRYRNIPNERRKAYAERYDILEDLKEYKKLGGDDSKMLEWLGYLEKNDYESAPSM